MSKSALRLVAILSAGILLLSACGAAPSPKEGGTNRSLIREIQNRGVLRVGVASWEPGQYKDASTGEWKGIHVDVLRDWAKETLKVDVEFVDTTWENIVAGLQAGQYDIAGAINARPARAVVVTFSDGVLSGQGAYLLDPKAVAARTWDELNDPQYTICVIQGTAEDLTVSNLDPKAQMLRLADQDSCRLALTSGRANAFMDNWASFPAFIEEHNGQYAILVPDPPQNLEGVGFAIAHGYSYDDIQALNIQIQTFIAKGLMAKSMQANRYSDPANYTLK